MNKKWIHLVWILAVTAAIFVFLQVFPFSQKSTSDISSNLPNEKLRRGYELSRTYCIRCHTYPAPELLPKETWLNETLPAMGTMLGIFNYNGRNYPVQNTPGLSEDYYPDEPLITSDDWQKILDFYEYASPTRLSSPERSKINPDTLFFQVHTPQFPAKRAPVVSTGLIDPGNRLIYLSDANSSSLMVFDHEFILKDQFSIQSPVSDLQILNDSHQPGKRELLMTYIGHMNPSDEALGSVVEGWYNPGSGEADIKSDVVTDSLVRPVEAQIADITGDQSEEILISEFGHTTGQLSWLKKNNGSESKKISFIKTPGCIQSHVLDYTQNGLPDVVALCAQLDQAIYLFRNQGNGKFKKETLKQFHIASGSSSFELHDFNNDGQLDILYTSGDNADFSKIFKPYHGVYLLINDGNNNFEEEWFYPVNGAFQAVSRDFDKDGLLDIAAIAFFADHTNNPEEGFIFFKNEGDFAFTPYSHPDTKAGRWIHMDVADWNGNGYDDILLSNFSVGPTIRESPFQRNWSDGPPFILLENQFGW